MKTWLPLARNSADQEDPLSDSRPLLVFFSSETSGPARRMESLLAHLARKERERLRVMHVDLDRNPEVGQKFRITTVPTLVLVKEKRVVGRIDGRASAPKIERMLEPHLVVAA
jgi:thioredoxin 1